MDEARHAFPLSEVLGMRVEDAVDGVAVARLIADASHHNPYGVVHGAVLFAMADTAMGAATLSVLDDGRACASIDVHLRFLARADEGELACRAQVLRAGRRVVHLDASVTGPDGRLVATATGAFAVLE